MSHGKGIGAKFDAFGWNVIDLPDGNDVEAIYDAVQLAYDVKGKPTCIVLNTVKGQGRDVCRAVRRAFFAADSRAVGRSD